MKKIPTLFERVFENHKVVQVNPIITPGCEEAFLYGRATIKWDGQCCAVINGKLYQRYDAKKGIAPENGIPCQDPDPITGHWPHWIPARDKWILAIDPPKENGTYEAIGKHFQSNPYDMANDILIPHGQDVVDIDRTFEAVKEYLATHEIEGLVFWLDEPVCKIKRKDFGYKWPVKT